MRDADQTLAKLSFLDPLDGQFKMRTAVDLSYVTTVEVETSLYKETEADATKWVYKDGFGMRRRYWYPGTVPVISNIFPINATYTINYQDGLITFNQALNSTPAIANLQYFEETITSGYNLKYNAQQSLVLNEISTVNNTWKDVVFSGAQDLALITEPWYIVTAHTKLWQLRVLSLEFATAESKTVKVLYSTVGKDFDKSFVWAGITNPTTETFIDFSGEDPIRFDAGSEIKIQISKTLAPCMCYWHFLTEERT